MSIILYLILQDLCRMLVCIFLLSISRFCTRDPRAVPLEPFLWRFQYPLPVTVPPIVPSLRMYLRVTRLAQRNQIAPIVRATFTQRLLVVNLFRLHDNSTFKTRLTKWMLRCVLITDPLPCSAVSLLRSFIPAVLFIIAVDLLLMLRAVSSIS